MKIFVIASLIVIFSVTTLSLFCHTSFSQDSVTKIVENKILRYKEFINKKKEIINDWKNKKNMTMTLTILVGILGICSSVLQSFKKKWCGVSIVIIGGIISAITLVNSTVFDADFREYKKAVKQGDFLIKKLDDKLAELKYVQDVKDVKEVELNIAQIIDQFGGIESDLSGLTAKLNTNLVSVAYAMDIAVPYWIPKPPIKNERFNFLGVGEDISLLTAKGKAIEDVKLNAYDFWYRKISLMEFEKRINIDSLCERLSMHYEVFDTYFYKDASSGFFNYYVFIEYKKILLAIKYNYLLLKTM